jgi:broad specificity phosphatase PhoE
MLTLYLVRHGEKEEHANDPPLTQKGREQAKKTAEKLADISFDCIIVSPSKRTKQTAEIISANQSVDYLIEDRLTERIEWEGDIPFETFIHEWEQTDIDIMYVPPFGRSSNANGVRVSDLVDELDISSTHKNILLVTHGGTIGDFLRSVLDETQLPHVMNLETGGRYIEIAPCSVTILSKESTTYRAVQINNLSHL